MGFLSPWFLLGSLAVGIPIWLHLIRREQPIRLPFSSLMFFRRMPVKSVSRQRLRYYLLLATRCLVILLIALAFARPYLPFAAPAFSSTAKDKQVVVLLDTSMSMQYGDRWQRALAAARDAIAGLGERDQAQIVPFSSEYEIRNLPTSDKAALRAILEAGLSPTASPTSYTQAFRAVDKIAEDLRRPLSVILITDLQKSGIGKGAQNFPSSPLAEFKLVDVGGQDAPNWTVEGVRSHSVIYQTRYPDRMLVQVRGFSTPEVTKDVTLSLGKRVLQRKTIQVPSSGAATVAFEGFDVPLGSNQGEVRISPSDGLPLDDAFHFVLERRAPYRILFLHERDEAAELYYFRSALAAEPDSPFVIDARTPADADSARLQDYAIVIWSNVAEAPTSLISGLRDFVKQGGGMLATMGSRFPSPSLETQWKELWPGKGIEKRLLTADAERMVLLGQFDKEHPLFREFQESGAESLRSAEIFGYIRFQPDSTVLLRLSNGDPALLEKQYGQGRMLLFASSFDNVWSDFPLHPAFIPLAHQLVRYAAQLPEEPPAYTIPAAVPLSQYKRAGASQPSAQVWDVIGPDGKREVPLAQELRPDFLVLRQAGFYELRQADRSHLVAANTDPRESDLTRLAPEDRALWIAGSSAKQDASNPDANPDLPQRQNIWWNLLLIAFIMALVEVYLANQYLGRRSTTAAENN